MKNVFIVTGGIIVCSILTSLTFYFFLLPDMQTPKHMHPFQGNIVRMTADNTDFRHVIFTGAKSQLVVMSIPAGGEVGQETHKHTEQILSFQSGNGEAILDGVTTPVGPGDVVIVTPGTEHNLRNTGNVPLKIMTVYSPPNHIDGRIHHTKADADADLTDEAFGEAQWREKKPQ